MSKQITNILDTNLYLGANIFSIILNHPEMVLASSEGPGFFPKRIFFIYRTCVYYLYKCDLIDYIDR